MNVLARDVRQLPVDEDSGFARDAVVGLSARPKQLSPKYFYDEKGSQLFEQITAQPEYYPTRAELAILVKHGPEIAKFIPPRAAVIEFGSGSTRKARLLLDAAPQVEAYVPVDISGEMLAQEAAALASDYPKLTVVPVTADFMQPFALPDAIADRPRTGFFPGSTIGNFEPYDAASFLRHAGRILGAGATLIIGFDLIKDSATLNAAYNDAAGVTADFNLNLLERMNRELGADFDPDAFSHRAFYNTERRRIEMHLASLRRQKVKVAGRIVEFRAGETIHTENSYKYSADSFGALARGSGWTPVASWTDPQGYFAVQALSATPPLSAAKR
jgi:dimethylhistidine N-methyltransferase